MTEQTTCKCQKLSYEILGLLAASFAVSFFFFQFLSLTADSIVASYYEYHNLTPTYAQITDAELWVFSGSLITAVCFFITLFLFLLGQKLAYIYQLTRGVEALQTPDMDFLMPLEGNNELTRLAETINYLSATQRQIREKEKALNEEKEQLIRTLSHDIRTPLTSILSYSEFLSSPQTCSPEALQEYLPLIQKKALQIRELTDILLDGGKRNPERFEDARLLMEQLIGEFEDALEDNYKVSTDFAQCSPFAGIFDVQELRRIFDNLISNVEKYADREKTIYLLLRVKDGQLTIRQENNKRILTQPAESYQMGLNSIRRIAHHYGGQVEVEQDSLHFAITITLSSF